jgi:hypothetical protein
MLRVYARVSDVNGFMMANVNTEVPSTGVLSAPRSDEGGEGEVETPSPYTGLPTVSGHDAMKAFALQQKLHWAYVTMGGKPVVTQLQGKHAAIPSAAWVLTRLSPLRRVAFVNCGMADVEMVDGDVLEWRMMSMAGGLPQPANITLDQWLANVGEEAAAKAALTAEEDRARKEAEERRRREEALREGEDEEEDL